MPNHREHRERLMGFLIELSVPGVLCGLNARPPPPEMEARVGGPELGEVLGLHSVQPAGRDERERTRQSAVYVADC
jgi:hypothetical protein